jgi:predicted ATP-dependent protease
MSTDHDRVVPVEALRWQMEASEFGFTTTDEVTPHEEIIGQEAAVNAIRLGLDLRSFGYNIFITGLVGTGRMTVVRRLLKELAAASNREVPLYDFCYVHSFVDPSLPVLLRLPPGEGCRLARAMEKLVTLLKHQIPQVFESDAYGAQRRSVVESYRERQRALIESFRKKVEGEGFAVMQVQMGPITRPDVLPQVEGEPVAMDQLDELAEAGKIDKDRVTPMREQHAVLREELAGVVREMRAIERKVSEEVEVLEREVMKETISDPIQEIRRAYDHPGVGAWLDGVESDLLDNASALIPSEDEEESGELDPDLLDRYAVNVVVDNARTTHAPIISETHPTHASLFGTVDTPAERDRPPHANHTHLRAGALMRADGGFVILTGIDVLGEAGLWPALKRTLRTGRVEIRSEHTGPFQWATALKPEAAKIRTKVVIIGDARMHSILYQLDEDFQKVFKVKAEFDAVMPRSPASAFQYAGFVAKIARSESLPPFDASAVAQVVEYGVRRAGDQTKLSTHFTFVKDVIVEAAYWARQVSAEVVSAAHVDQAVSEKIRRVNLVETKVREAILRDRTLIDTAGEVVGQVNGLAVYGLGDHAFGAPARITATVGAGTAGIINVEREAAMSGATHDKGILILSGFLRKRFARITPVALSASVCFEQSYGSVDGDSASSTEIYALLSALSGLPLRQSIAVTGSTNQHGEIQPIGGVNEKIEGFYDVCRERGLDGTHGVIIPTRNVSNLMLREDVVGAVRAGDFRVMAVATIDEGIELLTGVPAGEAAPDGSYPPDSVNGRVAKRLKELAQAVRDFGGFGISSV